MKIHVQYSAYDSGGHELTLSLCGWFIERRLGEYGDAIEHIWVMMVFPPPPRSDHLESLRTLFVDSLDSLPRYRFLRKKRSMEIQAITNFVRPAFRSRHINRTYPCTPDLFASGIREVIRIVSPMTSKFTRKDAFDTAAFLRDLAACINNLPTTEEEIEALRQEQHREIEEDRRNADPWERLDIDWDEFHRGSRKLLNDPFYWEQSDDLAPNGNDTGADVLNEYSDWREQNKRGDPFEWLHALLESWEVDPAMAPTHSSTSVLDLLKRSEFSVNTWDDAAIGLAFACLKVDGKVAAPIASIGLRAIERQSLDAVIENRGWRDADERRTTLAKMAAFLKLHARE